MRGQPAGHSPAPDNPGDRGTGGESPGVRGRMMTRRQFLKRTAGTVIGAGLLTGGYAWQGEPRWLQTVRLELGWKDLPASFDGVRIVHISDIHLGFNKDAGDTRRLVNHIQSVRPDLICFSGDIVDSYAEDMAESVPILAELTAPLGRFAILGNHDYKNTELLAKLWKQAGFRLLRNEHEMVELGGSRIAVAGMEDQLHGEPNPRAALGDIPDDVFTVLLMHEPDYADLIQAYPVRLQLSGHSHGGQIRLPVLGALFTPDGSLKYIDGLYEIGGRGMKLYVNRGFGETYMPIRFLCRPELTVITLRRN
ncbi:metallophosphoesterase [Paenibacillus glufosinatiresistens]|uniref:metallophosphoesterase n=1 Tax=Paenibacillus glufosinatiresistens TaxID=3070657 RepID=UPI00286D872F|nr:metallophosphoesterase [Paenibacillus sp. YX.27]